MTTSSDRASRLRQALHTLAHDCQRQLEVLLPKRQLIQGSAYGLQTRCGKSSCHCAAKQGPLHTSTAISWSEHGKTRLRTLPPRKCARLRQWTDDYRRFRQARAALVKLQRRMLDHIDRLEKALRLPPPKPAARPAEKIMDLLAFPYDRSFVLDALRNGDVSDEAAAHSLEDSRPLAQHNATNTRLSENAQPHPV